MEAVAAAEEEAPHNSVGATPLLVVVQTNVVARTEAEGSGVAGS